MSTAHTGKKARPDSPPGGPVPLTTAAMQLGSTVTALIEAALAGELTLSVMQAGWRWDAAYLDDDVATFMWADDKILDLKGPPRFAPGLVSLQPDQIDLLRGGPIYLREAVDPVSGLRVRLLHPIWIGWEGVLIEPGEWERFMASATAAQLPRTSSPAINAERGLKGTISEGTLGQPPPRWGSVDEAAAMLGVSRDTLDRMRVKQRRKGWIFPCDPVPVGQGKKRRRERWDLDRVAEWATAYRDKTGEGRPRRPASSRSGRQRTVASARASVAQADTGPGSRPAGTASLYARAKAKVAAQDSDA